MKQMKILRLHLMSVMMYVPYFPQIMDNLKQVTGTLSTLVVPSTVAFGFTIDRRTRYSTCCVFQCTRDWFELIASLVINERSRTDR